MENVTLGQISSIVLFLGTFFGGIGILLKYIKKWLKSMLNDEFQSIKKEITDIGISNCKNFLVSCMAKIESGQKLDEAELERFYEEYDEYTNKWHQNSYIHAKYDKLKKEGKL